MVAHRVPETAQANPPCRIFALSFRILTLVIIGNW